MGTKEYLAKIAAMHGWELVSDQGYRQEYRRGEGLMMQHGSPVRERMVLHFSDSDAGGARQLIRVYNHYPTGDVTALKHEPIFGARHADYREKGKRSTAAAWFAECRYAMPGVNAALRKMGIEPVLPESPEEAQ